MASFELSFRAGEETIRAVILRQVSKSRWNAFFWGGGLRFAHTFARRAAAELWIGQLIRKYFPTHMDEALREASAAGEELQELAERYLSVPSDEEATA